MKSRTTPPVLDYLVQRYGQLKRQLTRRLGNSDLASDVLHDAYVRLQGMPSIPERENPGAYLMHIATNIAIDKQRKDSRSVSDSDVHALLESVADPTPGPDELAQTRFDFNLIAEQINRMPEQRRLVMIMVHWEQLPQQDVADRLGVSRRTVSNELQRAHKQLAEFMQQGA